MLVCLIFAFISTLLWLNITLADITNKANSYNNDNKEVAKIKTILSIIMALFWAIIIRYWNHGC